MPAVPHHPVSRPKPGAAEAGFLGPNPASGSPSPRPYQPWQTKPTQSAHSQFPLRLPVPKTTAQPQLSHGQRAKRKLPHRSPNNPHPNPFNDNALPTPIPKWGKTKPSPSSQFPVPQTTPQPPPTRRPNFPAPQKQPLNHGSATANARSANLFSATSFERPAPQRLFFIAPSGGHS